MTAGVPRVSAAWLDLREAADAAARAPELVEPVRRRLAGTSRAVIHDLGSGTGSMGRWLSPRLPGPQHWILYDRDADLLAHAGNGMNGNGMNGNRTNGNGSVTVETRQRDISRLTAADLDGAALVTASALLDMLTADEVERVVAACAGARCQVLFTLSVIGRVELTSSDPLDVEIAEAFNAHQRRTTGGRKLLGPDAVDATAAAFERYGADVRVRSSPWRLGADRAELAVEWLDGWLDAACEQRPELAGQVAYARRRRSDAAAGRLGVVVHHSDLLVSWE
jgi:hypothetical protein